MIFNSFRFKQLMNFSTFTKNTRLNGSGQWVKYNFLIRVKIQLSVADHLNRKITSNKTENAVT